MRSLYILLIAVLIALTFAAVPAKKVAKKPSWCVRYVRTMKVTKALNLKQKKFAVKRCNKLMKKAKTAKKFRIVKKSTKKFLKRYHVKKPSTKRLRVAIRRLYKKSHKSAKKGKKSAKKSAKKAKKAKKSAKKSTRRVRRVNRRRTMRPRRINRRRVNRRRTMRPRRINRRRTIRRRTMRPRRINRRRTIRKTKKIVKKVPFKTCKGKTMQSCLAKRAKKQQKTVKKQLKTDKKAYQKRQKIIAHLRKFRRTQKKVPKKVIKIVPTIKKPVTKPIPKVLVPTSKPAPVRCPKTAVVQVVATESYQLRSCLEENDGLKMGQGLVSKNGKYHFVYQRDGNVVIYRDNKKAVWASNTWRKPSTSVNMQADGHLVLYNKDKAMWWTGYWVPQPAAQVHKYMVVLNNEGFIETYDGKNKLVHVYKYTAPK